MARKILIVDDNAINRQLLRKTLGREYDVLEAGDGKEALGLMRRNFKILSAVLLDIMMPEMDGYELLRCVRDNVLLAQIPIIIVTGAEDEESRVKALALGANDFISKPFNPDIVRHCLRNSIALRETASILNAIQKDKLTGLFNRETFFEKVGAAIRDREPGHYILSCFDIDNFKLINDQYGAAEGDRILREIGKAIHAEMNRSGGIAGRISADNFAALFPVTQKNTNILQKIQETLPASPEQRSIVFSVGRYLVSDLSLPASAIYDRAYIAKQSVKGRFDKHMAYFDEPMLEKLVRDQQITGEMEAALARGQFEVWFQPQYNHVTGALVGAEALARWRHPQKGVVPPGDFIPLFEQNGFVYELDKFVWREVCRYLRKWTDAGYEPLPVSINISRYDIFRADLVEVITELVQEYAVPIDLLRLEITESAFARSTEPIVKIVKQLIALGFTIEIDDFGSGYSSLNTLKNVPAQVVKLDMRFLKDDDGTRRGGNILESIVRMAKWLGMAVIAEGVETQEQGDFLKSIGCSHVQGYLYAQPMPADAYEAHFQNVRREGTTLPLETVDKLDSGMFWDPNSMDTLIFNNFVGAACVCEYHEGALELLRATEKFARMLGGDDMTVDDVLKLDLMAHLNERDRRAMLAGIEESACSKRETSLEVVLRGLPGGAAETYMRAALRVIASTQDRYLVYFVSENISAQRLSERKERRVVEQLRAVMDNLGCGVTAATVREGRTDFLLANSKYYELMGYTREEYAAEIGESALAMILPEDRARVDAVIAQVCATGLPASMEYRARRRDGGLVWLRSLLSVTVFEGVDAQVQLCTYADVTAEKHAVQELLDNLPGGAALYEYGGGELTAIHMNKRYWQLVEREPMDYDKLRVLDNVHPDDRGPLARELAAAISERRDAACDIRVRHGAEGYCLFHVLGRIVPRGDGKYSIYASYLRSSDEAESIREMLPVALTAVMASSSDLSFVKDKNLRYVCCSRAFARMVGLENEKDVAGKSDYDLFEPALAEQYVRDDRALMASRQSIVDLVEHLPSADGKDRYSSTSKYLLYDSRQNIVGLYGTGRDITQEREAETQHEFLINSIPGGVAIYEGIWTSLESIQLAYFSDGFCRLFGYTREEYEKLGKMNPTGLIAAEYIAGLIAQIERLLKLGTPIDYIYRAHGKDGERWIHLKAVTGERRGQNMSVNAVFFDVTARQEALERLRISEEENRLAARHSRNLVCRYDVAARSLRLPPGVNPSFHAEGTLEDVPRSQLRAGLISPETAKAYQTFYETIQNGEKDGETIFQRKSDKGWRWLEAHFSTIFSDDGKPVSAVVSFVDVTENMEKDAAYEKWRQSIRNKEPESFSLFRCNVSKRAVLDKMEGKLLPALLQPGELGYDEYVAAYAAQYVAEEDRGCFTDFLNVDALLEKYYRGERIVKLEYREALPQDASRWLRLTVDLVEYPYSADVEAYMLFEDIDAAKRAELLTRERAETDPLTGVLNRTTFAERVEERIRAAGARTQHALLMLDIDGFKMVNDVFGHSAGDQTLIDIANLLGTILRRDDLVGRLGGDEFLVFLNSIPGEKIAATKARQICELSRRTFSPEVQISGSVGIAVCPQDGADFETLYKKADETLYHVKSMGRDNYAFYHEDMAEESAPPLAAAGESGAKRERMRRMLIVDDSRLDFELLANMFRQDYIIEKALDGASALTRLRHYGTAISVMLLDLMMPDMDGFTVLERMQRSAELRAVPVIVVSADENRETSLRAIRAGATDFVTKPVDPDILRIRVQSAVSKAENERLRAKNSFLELQEGETAAYKTVLDRLGVAVVELDWGNGTFLYSPSVPAQLAGNYDGRTLWHILLSDQVAEPPVVRELQQLVHDVAEERSRTEGSASVLLRAPGGGERRFRVDVYKLAGETGLTEKIILSFRGDDAGDDARKAPKNGRNTK